MSRGHDVIEAALWERIRRHVSPHVIEEAGTPTIEWRPALRPPIGETVVFRFVNNDVDTEVSFVPDGSVLARITQGGPFRMDAWRDGQRSVVSDWTDLDDDRN